LPESGIARVFVTLLRHTSASLLIQENADPDKAKDLETFFSCRSEGQHYRHSTEGLDDMPAHIRTSSHPYVRIYSDGSQQTLLGNLAGHLYSDTASITA